MTGAVEVLGPRHPEVKRLRMLLRDRATRASESSVVLEGLRLITGVLDRGVPIDTLYLGPAADQAFGSLVARVRASGARVVGLKDGVLERIGSVKTPQPVLATAKAPTMVEVSALAAARAVIVAVGIADPGNLGTLLRSAEAAGVGGVVCAGDSVDVRNPKVVRASAGAIFGVPVVEAGEPVEVLDALGAQGRTRYGTAASGGERYDRADLSSGAALVLGSEAHGLPNELRAQLDGFLTIPMEGEAESLNVAVAASIFAFEAARQREAVDS